MFEVSIEASFAAGHALRGYRGKCENPHGHNYRVRVVVEGPELDGIGLLEDFTELKRIVREVTDGLDHRFLNDQAPFDAVNPSAENLARYIFEQTERRLAGRERGVRLSSVTVWETDTAAATYRPEGVRNAR
jgi:6-pyruvoyltetrahydropterin/6-carboxytetrahydropterin synthase